MESTVKVRLSFTFSSEVSCFINDAETLLAVPPPFITTINSSGGKFERLIEFPTLL